MTTTPLLSKSTHQPDLCPICSLFREIEKQQQAKKQAAQASTVASPEASDAKAPSNMEMQDARAEAHRQRRLKREALTRAMATVEKTLELLPDTAAGIAGWLQALNRKGGLDATDHALTAYLKGILTLSTPADAQVSRYYREIRLAVGEEYLTLELDTHQFCVIPPAEVSLFVRGLRNGRFNHLRAV